MSYSVFHTGDRPNHLLLSTMTKPPCHFCGYNVPSEDRNHPSCERQAEKRKAKFQAFLKMKQTQKRMS